MTLPPEDPTLRPGTVQDETVVDPLFAPPAASIPADPSVAYETGPDAGSSSTKERAIQTRDEAKDRAVDVKDTAVDAGTHVAGVAKDQAGSVAAEAGQHAKNLLSQTRDELTTQANEQQQRLAGGLHTLCEELHSMARGNDQSGLASDLVRQAGDRSRSLASWLENREPGDVLSEVASFARRRPGTFIALAGTAGVVVGRLARGLRDESASHTSDRAAALTSGYSDVHPASDVYRERATYSGAVLADGDTGVLR
jgi:gas vesicle protein